MTTTRMAALAALAVCGGCSGVTSLDGETEEPVVNGTVVPGTDRFVFVAARCSGTLVTNDWALTAQHCNVQNGEGVELGGKGGTARFIDRVIHHPTLDFELLHLSSPMPIGGRTTGFKSAFFTYTPRAGMNSELQGTGPGTVADCQAGGTNGGTERAATFYTDNTSFPDQYNINWYNNQGQGAGPGDSGAPSWFFWRGVPYQIGILKNANCQGLHQSALPQTFEAWVFANIYHAPIPIPLTSACHNYMTCASFGTGEWNLPPYSKLPSKPGDFWDRPLHQNYSNCTDWFDPCEGSTNSYIWRGEWELNGADTITVSTATQSTTLRGSSNNGYWGSGKMRICYQSGSPQIADPSPGMNWMDVMCDYKGSAAGNLVCHGSRCRTTNDPILPNSSESVRWTPCGGSDFYYFLKHSTAAPDSVTVNGQVYTGEGQASWVYVPTGTTTVSYATGSVNQYSHGIYSLYAVCRGW